MSLSQKAGTPRRRTQRAPAKRANRHAAIPLAAQRHFFGARLTPPSRTAGKRWKAPCRPACPTNIQYPVNTPVPAESQTRGPPHATGTPLISRTSLDSRHFFLGGTPPCTRNRLPPKSAFRPLFAPSAPQPPRSGRRLPFPRAVDRRSDAAVCQSGAFTRTTTVHLRGKRPTICSDPAPLPASSASATRRRPVRKHCKPASRGKGRPAVQPQLILRR